MKSAALTPEILDYLSLHTQKLHPALEDLRRETDRLPDAVMQIPSNQGAILHLLAKLLNAKRILEIGCYTGYSAISMALALPADGKLFTLDIDPKNTEIAKKYFTATELDAKIDLRLGPALKSIADIASEFGPGSFDLVFIDADKENYPEYYERGLSLLRIGGLIVVDNTLRFGGIVNPADQSAGTVAIRKLNDRIRGDERVDRVMIGVADGLYLARKR